MNHLLLDYCRRNQIALWRSRPLKKNDNCWVEQNNWTHVRKLVGYHRLSGELQHRLLKDLYRVWSLWRNYFQPVMRLESKTRTGSKVHRRYDVPATPCQRLLASGQVQAERLISHRVPLSEGKEAIELTETQPATAFKVLLQA